MRLQQFLALVAVVGSGSTWIPQVKAVSTEARTETRAPEEQVDVREQQGSVGQHPMLNQDRRPAVQSKKKLTGKFLHITDFHPDPFYKVHSSSDKGDACHKGDGSIGFYGAERSDCDSPISLINATFNWIGDNIKDEIDFVVWTGDSARHDNDEDIPRNADQVEGQNQFLVDKFVEVFGKSNDPEDPDPLNNFIIPIIPTYGNNDILPHNIMDEGPNRWTKEYLRIWRQFIPEEQRHQFERGGWFFVEAIPNKLAVFSLNTLYFFTSNSAVDGCAKKSEPGYQQMEWLRIQLQFLRIRGMKAILIGHVPPARTESKTSWDETCWQKYTLWLQQYRDVVITSIYGHMNIDHFILQDFKDIEIRQNSISISGGGSSNHPRPAMDDHLTVQSSTDYLLELRDDWSNLPKPPQVTAFEEFGHIIDDLSDDQIENILKKKRRRKGHKGRKQRFFDKVGGEFAERYSLSLISPSVVPNYFPTLRIIEYNITGLDELGLSALPLSTSIPAEAEQKQDEQEDNEKPTWWSRTTRKKHKKDKLIIPDPPSKSAPPGPAYSPQTLSLLGYTQYFANLTYINNEGGGQHDQQQSLPADQLSDSETHYDDDNAVHPDDKKGKHDDDHKKKKKQHKIHPKEFNYEVEYSTLNDSIYKLKDMTVMSCLKLAQRIGQFKPTSSDDYWDSEEELESEEDADAENREDSNDEEDDDDDHDDDEVSSRKSRRSGGNKNKGKKHDQKAKKGKKDKKKREKIVNKVWFTFVRRAYVDTKDESDIHDNFGKPQ